MNLSEYLASSVSSIPQGNLSKAEHWERKRRELDNIINSLPDYANKDQTWRDRAYEKVLGAKPEDYTGFFEELGEFGKSVGKGFGDQLSAFGQDINSPMLQNLGDKIYEYSEDKEAESLQNRRPESGDEIRERLAKGDGTVLESALYNLPLPGMSTPEDPEGAKNWDELKDKAGKYGVLGQGIVKTLQNIYAPKTTSKLQFEENYLPGAAETARTLRESMGTEAVGVGLGAATAAGTFLATRNPKLAGTAGLNAYATYQTAAGTPNAVGQDAYRTALDHPVFKQISGGDPEKLKELATEVARRTRRDRQGLGRPEGAAATIADITSRLRNLPTMQKLFADAAAGGFSEGMDYIISNKNLIDVAEENGAEPGSIKFDYDEWNKAIVAGTIADTTMGVAGTAVEKTVAGLQDPRVIGQTRDAELKGIKESFNEAQQQRNQERQEQQQILNDIEQLEKLEQQREKNRREQEKAELEANSKRAEELRKEAEFLQKQREAYEKRLAEEQQARMDERLPVPFSTDFTLGETTQQPADDPTQRREDLASREEQARLENQETSRRISEEGLTQEDLMPVPVGEVEPTSGLAPGTLRPTSFTTTEAEAAIPGAAVIGDAPPVSPALPPGTGEPTLRTEDGFIRVGDAVSVSPDSMPMDQGEYIAPEQLPAPQLKLEAPTEANVSPDTVIELSRDEYTLFSSPEQESNEEAQQQWLQDNPETVSPRMGELLIDLFKRRFPNAAQTLGDVQIITAEEAKAMGVPVGEFSEGFHVNGQSYLIVDQIRGADEKAAWDRAAEVMWHEAFGHGIKESMITRDENGNITDQSQWDSFLDRVRQGVENDPLYQQFKDQNSELSDDVILQEWIAEMYAEGAIDVDSDGNLTKIQGDARGISENNLFENMVAAFRDVVDPNGRLSDPQIRKIFGRLKRQSKEMGMNPLSGTAKVEDDEFQVPAGAPREDTLFATRYISPLNKALGESKQGKAPPKQWAQTIKKIPGVKPEELETTGIIDFLESSEAKSLTKEEVMQEVEKSNVEIVEDKFGGLGPNNELMEEAVDEYAEATVLDAFKEARRITTPRFKEGRTIRDSETNKQITFDEARDLFNNVPPHSDISSTFKGDPTPVQESQYEDGQRFFVGGGLPPEVIVTEVDEAPANQFNLFTRKEEGPRKIAKFGLRGIPEEGDVGRDFEERLKDAYKEAEFGTLTKERPFTVYSLLEQAAMGDKDLRIGNYYINNEETIDDLVSAGQDMMQNMAPFIRDQLSDPERLGSDITGAPGYYPGADLLGSEQEGSIMGGDYNEYRELLIRKKPTEGEKEYNSIHWRGYPNVIAHLRTTRREDKNRNYVYMIEELQSDWGQTISENLTESLGELYTEIEGSFDYTENNLWWDLRDNFDNFPEGPLKEWWKSQIPQDEQAARAFYNKVDIGSAYDKRLLRADYYAKNHPQGAELFKNASKKVFGEPQTEESVKKRIEGNVVRNGFVARSSLLNSINRNQGAEAQNRFAVENGIDDLSVEVFPSEFEEQYGAYLRNANDLVLGTGKYKDLLQEYYASPRNNQSSSYGGKNFIQLRKALLDQGITQNVYLYDKSGGLNSKLYDFKILEGEHLTNKFSGLDVALQDTLGMNKLAGTKALKEDRENFVYVIADNIQDAHRQIADMQDKDAQALKTPKGPYVSSTKAWTDLSLRRALGEAIENGDERLGVSPDEVHERRWGRDFGYYDNIVRKRLDALAKKYKSKSGYDYLDTYIPTGTPGKTQQQGYHYLEINDKMIEAYEEGVPLFSTRKPPVKTSANLTKEQVNNAPGAGKARKLWFQDSTRFAGEELVVRPDLNSSVDGTKVIAMHNPKSKKMDAADQVGNVRGYTGIIALENVTFPVNQSKLSRIYQGAEAKTPFTGVRGTVINEIPNDYDLWDAGGMDPGLSPEAAADRGKPELARPARNLYDIRDYRRGKFRRKNAAVKSAERAVVVATPTGGRVYYWKPKFYSKAEVEANPMLQAREGVDTATNYMFATRIPNFTPQKPKGLRFNKVQKEVYNLLKPTVKSLDYTRKALNRKVQKKPINSKEKFVLPDGKIIYTGDGQTTDNWIEQVESALSPAEIRAAKRWYPDVRKEFEKAFGKEKAPVMMLAWALGNKAESPLGAMQNVLRVGENLANTIDPEIMKKGGLNNDAIMAVLQGQTPEGGSGVKLYDFVDAAIGSNYRNWTGFDQRMGAPAVVDRHTWRDRGYVDPVLVNVLSRELPNDPRVKQLQIDRKGASVTDPEYEETANWLRNLTDDLNKRKYLGVSNWKPNEVQAVGWMGITKATGQPEGGTPGQAISQTARSVAYELSFGEGTPYSSEFPGFNDLRPEEKSQITYDVNQRIGEIATEVSGVQKTDEVSGLGFWEDFPAEPNQVMKVQATKEGLDGLINVIGFLGQQTEVFAFGPKNNARKVGFDFFADEFSNPETIEGFYRALREALPDYFSGGSQVTINGKPGIRMVAKTHTSEGKTIRGTQAPTNLSVPEKKLWIKNRAKKILKEARPIIEKFASDNNLTVKSDTVQIESFIAHNNWEKNPNGEIYRQRIDSRFRPEVSRRIQRDHAKEIRDRIASGIRNAPSTRLRERAESGVLFSERQAGTPTQADAGSLTQGSGETQGPLSGRVGPTGKPEPVNSLGGESGRDFANFFSRVTKGEAGKSSTGAPFRLIQKSVESDDSIVPFAEEYRGHQGNFDDHIAHSIPGYRDTQINVGNAILETYRDQGADMLDIGASEGALPKALTRLSNGNIRTVSLDPNLDMKARFDQTPVEGAEYVAEAFSDAETAGQLGWVEDDGTQVFNYNPDRKFDVVQEAMVFQFISADRDLQIPRIKELLKDDGVAIIEEKVFRPVDPNDAETLKRINRVPEFVANEDYKDKNYKSRYFTEEEIEAKKAEVLQRGGDEIEGMEKYMVPENYLVDEIRNNFNHAVQFWDSGNFKGWLASDSQEKMNALLNNIRDTNTEFSTAQTPKPLFSTRQIGPNQTTPQQGSQQATPRQKKGVNKVLNAGKTFFEPFANLVDADQYRDRRNLLRGEVAKINDYARDIYNTFLGSTPEEVKAIFDFYETRGADPNTIRDPAKRDLAVRTKQEIENRGEELVRRGMLDKRSFDKFQGQYLPRVYLKHLLNDSDYKAAGAGTGLSDMGYLKQRQDLPAATVELLQGQVKDPSYLVSKTTGQVSRDLAVMQFFDDILAKPEWALQKSLISFDPLKEINDIILAGNYQVDTQKLLADMDLDPYIDDQRDALKNEIKNQRSQLRQLMKDKPDGYKDQVMQIQNQIKDLQAKLKPLKPLRVTPQWLIGEANRIKEQIADIFLQNPAAYGSSMQDSVTRNQIATEMVDRFKELADQALTPEIRQEIESGEWKQIPDSARYGSLRGALVRPEIANDIIGTGGMMNKDRTDWVTKILGEGGILEKYHSWWKMSKVAANPPSWVRNTASNMILLQLSGVPWYRFPSLTVRAIQEMRNDGKYNKIAKKYGIGESSFSGVELAKIDREFKDFQRRVKGKDSKPMAAWLRAMGAVGKMNDWFGENYQRFETHGKLMKIIDAMERENKPENQAVREANESLFDYSEVSPEVKTIRRVPVGSAFITFQVKVLPQLLKTARKNPARFAPWVALSFALPAWAASQFDWTEDDFDEFMKVIPDWLQEKPHTQILPMKDSKGRFVATDATYFLPWGMYTEAASELGEGKPGEALKSVGANVFSGPVINIPFSLFQNKDTFTGKEIYDEKGTPGEKIFQVSNYIFNANMPGFLAGMMDMTDTNDYNLTGLQGATRRSIGALREETDSEGNPGRTLGQAAAGFAGVNLYPIDAPNALLKKQQRKRYELLSTRGEYRREQKEAMARATSDEDLDRRLDKLALRYEPRITKIFEEMDELMDVNLPANAQ